MTGWQHFLHLIAWGAGMLMVLWAALSLSRALGISDLLGRLLGCAILSCAQIVLAVETLSLVGLIAPLPLLAFHTGTVVCLRALGLRAPAEAMRPRVLAKALMSVTCGTHLRVLLLLTILAGLVLLGVIYRVPPNNHDGLTYHMTRVAAWLQQASLASGAVPDLRASILPANAEVLILWQVALLRHDLTAGCVQWMSWLGAMLAAFGIGRQAGLSERRAAFGALAFGSLPAVLLQATSVQNDLTVTFFVAATLYFASRALEGDWGSTLLAGLSLGLAVGTKPTAAFALPGLLLFLAARFRLMRPGAPSAAQIRAVGAAVVGVFVLGSHVYLANLVRFGSPSGPPAFKALMSPLEQSPRDWWSNGGRLALRLLDPAGLVPPGSAAARGLARSYDALTDVWFRALNVDASLPGDFMRLGWRRPEILLVHEDLAVFGPLYGAALALGAVTVLLAPRVDLRMRALGAAVLGYILTVAVLLRFQPFHGRLLITAAVIGAPLLGMMFRERPGRLNALANVALVATCGCAMATCVLYNDRKPLLGPGAVRWGDDRVGRMRLSRPGFEAVLRHLERLPAGRLVVLQPHMDAPVYPLYGIHIDRPVLLLHAGRWPSLSSAGLPDAEYLLVGGDRQTFFVEGEPLETARPWVDSRDLRPLRRELVASASGWTVLLDGSDYGDTFLFLARRRPGA